VLPIVERVLDRGCLISSLSSISIDPGENAQPIHADDQLLPVPKPHPPLVCNTLWALTDFTDANGATRIIPGSHTRDHSPEYGTEYASIPAEMRRGSVLIWHGSLWHGGGANRSRERRVGIAMNYCAGFIRQQENQQLGLSGTPSPSRLGCSSSSATESTGAVRHRRHPPPELSSPRFADCGRPDTARKQRLERVRGDFTRQRRRKPAARWNVARRARALLQSTPCAWTMLRLIGRPRPRPLGGGVEGTAERCLAASIAPGRCPDH
jgi:hypothetical protein